MITDLPTSRDFQESGIGFLNLAWEAAIDLLLDLKEWQIYGDDEEAETPREEYWKAAHRPLATATALAQQGIELLLKARIAEVSPLLLISGDPRDWPKGCDQKDISFAEFRTIDAQDLIRAVNTVCQTRIDNEFKQEFEKLRRLRNSIFHTVDKRIRFTAEEVLSTILYASHCLIGQRQWMTTRRKFVLDSPSPTLAGGDGVEILLVRELKQVIENLPPAKVLKFIGFKKKQRRYLCESCRWACADAELTADVAQLVPNTPTATFLHCYACNCDTKVIRQPCNTEGCKSNVLTEEDQICCVCGEGQ